MNGGTLTPPPDEDLSKNDALTAPDAAPIDLIAHPVALIRFGDEPAARFNPSACSLLGRAFAGERWFPLVAALGSAAAQNLSQLAGGMARNGAGVRTKAICETPEGALPIQFELARLGGSDNTVVAALAAAKTDPSALSEASQLYRVLQTLPVGLELFDPQFNALFYNAKSDELFDYWDGAIQNHEEWWTFAFPDASERQRAVVEWRKTVAAARADPRRAHLVEWNVTCRDGARRTVQFYYRFLGDRFSLVLWDVTEQRRLEAELRTSARTDSLTGLANRRALFDAAEAAVSTAREKSEPLTALMIDIDHFKTINDRLGHAAGDQVLRSVAQRAAEAIDDGLIARIGGEEFAAILPVAAPEEAERVAERLRAAIAAGPIETGEGGRLDVTISVGGAFLMGQDASAERLIERADRALYRAKEAGRNKIVFDEG